MSLPALLDHLRQTAALGQVAGLLQWDQEAAMPPDGAAQRAEQAGAMAAVLHGRAGDPRIPDWIAGIDRNGLSPADRRNVEEAERSYGHATKIPARLAQEIATTTSHAHRVWAKAREDRDVAAFTPVLAEVLDLKRQKAACLAGDGVDPYDALLDLYEPGARVADLAPLLEGLRAPLVALRERIAEKPAPAGLTGHFPAPAQLSLARDIAARLGYRFEAGRIDTVVHPFCSGHAGDVRITTRIDEADPLNCLYSTIHEVGHGLYAQGAPDPFLPAAGAVSMGVHESQSRFWENQVARSRAFADWLFPAMAGAFPGLDLAGPDAFYAAVNRVETGFIRTEADEVHYNLHILLRFELERELIGGTLAVADLEEAWNTRFARDFGRAVPNAALGVLQDVHWSAGLFGYFPTYSLGNIYAASLERAMRRDLPDFDAMLKVAEVAPVLEWLRERIHRKGRLLSAPALVEAATGEAPSAAPLIAYLERKFGALYGL
ncbi:MAG: carboxypeptidase M32 [Pseudomonadota bacterium]